ncbi:quinol dehydrogenase ferredoxin subunit NapH [Rhodoplanes sp. TEM]|uniref:Quinol dehydrogenase ferredoxin subunit NapH n=1 Tax=Rhodoplanes tepidamans TaxID=200616 RepID=A0ABT5JFZ9_RHOTP|nr:MULTISPECIES: quinol dehydrogenase ferredoxin subunit NapH [Rhodoplanes]MDC7788504.1 quinol dehydrogenase ferredoxin subunit NapH [Rhodoplanes tepidamans]MDC7984158.1 quinol dehydrogenase ferredoxin subunit NapH [Rhodoplanes sp. TEM]MDQ0356862.1 ferredoxin-type protein NapH [Rhodoplanes tepidamans]
MTARIQARIAGREAWALHGWWTAHKYLILRRLTQLGVLALFLSGPLAGVWIAKGTLAASLTFDALPLTDPFVVLQSLAARHWPETTALTGVAIVAGFYLVFGGRTFCAWVCPVNPVTDLAAWMRRRLGVEKGFSMRRETRWLVALAVLAAAAATGTVAWEMINPVTLIYRAALFGTLAGLAVVVAVFVFDLVVARDGWCGHVCPIGTAYALIGKATLLRVSARGRARCDDCLDCFAVCPESHVIAPALRGRDGAGPVIASGDCTACGRCVDVCPERVFAFTHRFDTRVDAAVPPPPPAAGRSAPAALEKA